VAAATWMHGVAGRCAAHADRPVLATDLVRVLPDAIAKLRRGERAW
jgi:NAD(P)H-hydrate repair Nnr-like enzyme with NAD(P)H-hydrate dehydratase domain